MKGKERKSSLSGVSESVVFLFLLSLLLCLMTLVMTVIPSDLNFIRVLMDDNLILTMNTIPILGTMILIYSISNHIGVSFFLTGIFCFAISEINRFKMIFRDDPFVFSDILLVSEATDMMGKYVSLSFSLNRFWD